MFPLDGVTDYSKEHAAIDAAFDEIVLRPILERLEGLRFVVETCQNDNRYFRCGFAHAGKGLQTGGVLQEQVEKDDVDGIFVKKADRFAEMLNCCEVEFAGPEL